MEIWSFSREEIEVLCTKTLHLTARSLHEQGKLTAKAADEFVKTHAVIIFAKESLFDKMKKLFYKDEKATGFHMRVVQLASLDNYEDAKK